MIYDTAGNLVRVWTTGGVLVWGDPPAPPDPPVPPTGPALNVARMCAAVNIGRTPSSEAGTFASTAHPVVVDVIDPTLEWVITSGFVATATGGTIRAAVQTGARAPVAVTWGGQSSVHIDSPSGASLVTLTSDPVPVEAYAGDTLHVLAWIDPDTTGAAPSDLTSTLVTDRGIGTGPWQSSPPLAQTTSPGGLVSGGTWSLRPSRIVAPSDQDAWIIVGDSIMQQTWSWGERAMDARGHAAVKTAQGGDAYIYYPARWAARVGAHAPHATAMLDEFGINDAGGTDALTIATRALAFWRQAQADGIDTIVKSTLTLAVSSSNNWADLAGQTVTERESGRTGFNTWLRDGAPLTTDGTTPVAAGTATAIRCTTISAAGTVTTRDQGHPLTAITDVVAAIESSPNSGKYAIGAPSQAMAGWSDGLHPSPGIHGILADRAARDLALLGY